MSSFAYLIATIENLQVVHVGIYSEGAMSLTNTGWDSTYAEILHAKRESYQDARDTVVQLIHENPGLHWTLKWIENEEL